MATQVRENGIQIEVGRGKAGINSTLLMTALAGAAALAVLVPFFFLGNASGHDFEFHLASWMDVAAQWRAGVFYPRWAALANWGFGEARFIFYPPASWMLGTALSFVLPWDLVPGVFIWLALSIAGIAMFTLAKEWLPTRDAMAAGALFAINPYHLVIVYWRSDFAELLASALIPLALLFAIRTINDGRVSVWLAVVVTGVWLSNAPAAVVVTYTVALVLLVGSAQKRTIQPLISGGAALALSLALAAFYIVPAAYEQPWVNISEVLSQGLRFPENFLFTRTADIEHTRFNFIVSWVATETISATLLAMIASRRWWRGQRRLSWILWAWVTVSTILMLPVTTFLWTYLPELHFVQFPWRWLLVLDVPFALCLAAAMGRLRGAVRYAAWAGAVAGLAITGFLLTRSNWWDPGGAADFYEEHFRNGAGYFGVDEYGPRGSDHYDLDQNAALVSFRSDQEMKGGANAPVQHLHWHPARKEFTVDSPGPVTAALRLLNYPAWRVKVNGEPVPAFSDEHTGQLLIALPAGKNRVQVSFVTTRDRILGDVVSMLALVGLLIGILAYRRRRAGSGPLPGQAG